MGLFSRASGIARTMHRLAPSRVAFDQLAAELPPLGCPRMEANLDHRSLYRLPWNLADNPIAWLEPTQACNLACDGCYRQNVKTHKSLDEVEAALDKKSSMGIVGNLDNYVKFQSANAMEAAAKNPGGDASAGVGMGMGFAMANQLGKTLVTPQEPSQGAPQPPPLPRDEAYYVGKNGKQAGPFDKDTVIGYINKGSITKETLMWKEGMAEWKGAALFGEFASLFRTATPPPLPK